MAGILTKRITKPKQLTGADLSAVAAFVDSVYPGVGAANAMHLTFWRERDGRVMASLQYHNQLTFAEAAALVNAGERIEVLEIEP